MTKRIGLGIACWNRPQYFQQLVSSLEANLTDLDGVDCHLFIDGVMCAFSSHDKTDPKLVQECIDIWEKALLPNKQLHKRFFNVSVGIHQFEMMQMLTSTYEKIIFLEDDIVVSPNFISIMKKVLNQHENDKDIFSISPGFKLLCDEKDADQNMDAMVFKEGHFWAEAIWSHKWIKIVPRLREYIDIIETDEYRKRDANKIMNLFVSHGRKMPATSQDNAKDWAISLSGMKRARLIVNRATGIGDVGIHSTKEKLAKSGDGHNKIYVSKEEKLIEDFKII